MSELVTFESIHGRTFEVGRLYLLGSRNLKAGVWNGETFIGLRDKFGLRLDSCETPHTVREITATDEVLPRSIGLREYFSRCAICRLPIAYVPNVEAREWMHVDLGDNYLASNPHGVQPRGETNWELFLWLLEKVGRR